jgi:molybdate transport system ATP-binding protein
MPAGPRPFLSLQQASFRLGERLVFENTSWTFHRGEQWALTGPNGSGKSLLADGVRGRLPLVGGDLRYNFRTPEGLSPEELIGHVAFETRKADVRETIVQSRWNSLEEQASLRVCDFLSYERVMGVNPFEVTGRHDAARPRFEGRRRRAVELLGIAPFLGRSLLSLSNGETQRVQLARALCHPLRLLILDEPFAGLDKASREHFKAVLERLMGTALRVLLVTTRLEDLPRRVTHLLCVEGCRVVAAGPRRSTWAELKGRTFPEPLGAPASRRRVPQVSNASRRRDAGAPRGDDVPLVQLNKVTVRYGDATILRNVNWTIRSGESWALLGANGSGKTTLLSLLLGDNPQVYANDVVVFGQRRGSGESVWELKQRIGWVSPELHLHFNDAATCFEVVASGFHESIGLFERPTARERAAVRAWLARFQLLEFADVPLFALSAGWQRMALLARALVKEPQLLVLDEPCQGLDGEHRQWLVNTVDSLIRAQAVSVIYVTHRLEEIPASIRKVLRLVSGRGKVVTR